MPDTQASELADEHGMDLHYGREAMHVHEWRFSFRENGDGSQTPGFYCKMKVCGYDSDSWVFLPEAERRLNATEELSAKVAKSYAELLKSEGYDPVTGELHAYAAALDGE